MKNKLKIRLSFFAVLLMLSLIVSAPHYFPVLLLTVTLHELGHFTMAKIRKIPIGNMRLGIFGASITPSGMLFSYTDEIMLCLGGPLFNFASAIIAVRLFGISPTSLFVSSSVALGTVNMLPVAELDGGRILSAILHRFFSPNTVQTVTGVISFTFIFALWCMSLYILIRAGASLSVFVFSVALFAKIFIPHTV